MSYVLANAFAINIIILDELQDGTIDKVDVFPESRSSDHCFAISIAWQLLAINGQYAFFEACYCCETLGKLLLKCFS